jgi:hypothetical protein
VTLFEVGPDPTADPDLPGLYNYWSFVGASRLAAVLEDDDASYILESGDGNPSSGTGNGQQSFTIAQLPVLITQVYSAELIVVIRWDEGSAPQSVGVRFFREKDAVRVYSPLAYPNEFYNLGGHQFFFEAQAPATAQADLMATQFGIEWSEGDGQVRVRSVRFVIDGEPYAGGGFRAMLMQFLLPVFGSGLLGASLDVGHAAGLARLVALRTRGRIRVQRHELARLAAEASALTRHRAFAF